MRTIVKLHPNLKPDSLLVQPKVIYVNSFNEDGYKQFDQDFNEAHQTGQNVIPVIIDSYGGQCYSLLGMVGIIRSSKIPVATILLSKAMSCGAVLFSCGNEGMRYMSEYSTLLIHDVSSFESGKVNDLKVGVEESERLNELFYEILDANCKKSKGYFKKIISKKGNSDWYITPQQAIKHNIANVIGIPTFNVEATINYNLKLK